MMERLWSGILERFGQDVTLRSGQSRVPVQALIQPYLEKGGEQELPGPMGLERQSRFRYIGPAGHPLDLDTLVEWKGKDYRVQRAQLVGEGVCPHWWAVLRPGEEEAL